MPVTWEIDPVSEDAGNAPLALVEPAYRLTAMDLTPPPVEGQYAGSVDTEGDPAVGYRHLNRIIRLEYLVRGGTDQAVESNLYALQQKVDKLRRERGTLKLTTQTGDTVTGDVLNAQIRELTLDRRYVRNRVIPLVLEFECLPYFRGTPILLGDHVETTFPCLIFTETGLAGDVPGLGKLVIDDDQGQDQSWVVWGVQSRYYDSAASAALFYEAEGRTPLGGSATAAGPAGASGGGSNVMRNTALATSYQAILSTQASGGGAHLSHIGTYRVFVRVQTPTSNTGEVSVALEWGAGDFRAFTKNQERVLGAIDEGVWRLLDMGLVYLPRVTSGLQRWEGRVLAKTTAAGDDIDADYLFLVPVDEGSGEVAVAPRVITPTAFAARDEFDQSAGALTGKTLPVGGTWVGSGDADDFTVDTTNHLAERSPALDDSAGVFGALAASGRFLVAGTSTFTDLVVQVAARSFDQHGGSPSSWQCVLARYVDTNNWLIFGRRHASTGENRLVLIKRVAGTVTTIASWDMRSIWGVYFDHSVPDPFKTVRLQVSAQGRWLAWAGESSETLTFVGGGQDAALATGGALASGKCGIYDENQDVATTEAHHYDDFLAFVPPADAAIFASQSLEIRHNAVEREDSSGVLLAKVAYEGDYLQVPPAGREGRTARFIVKACRNDPQTMPDSAIDDLSGRLTYTPRHLVLPA